MIHFTPSLKLDKQATIILIDKTQIKTKRFAVNDQALKKEILRLIAADQFNGENGQILPVVLDKKVFLLVGVGKKEDVSATALRTTLRKALLSPYISKLKTIGIVLNEQKDFTIKAAIEAVLIGTYSWKKYKTKEKDISINHDQYLNEDYNS